MDPRVEPEGDVCGGEEFSVTTKYSVGYSPSPVTLALDARAHCKLAHETFRHAPLFMDPSAEASVRRGARVTVRKE